MPRYCASRRSREYQGCSPATSCPQGFCCRKVWERIGPSYVWTHKNQRQRARAHTLHSLPLANVNSIVVGLLGGLGNGECKRRQRHRRCAGPSGAIPVRFGMVDAISVRGAARHHCRTRWRADARAGVETVKKDRVLARCHRIKVRRSWRVISPLVASSVLY